MNVYIFENIDELTDRYHEGGGLVVIANNKRRAKKIAEEYIHDPWDYGNEKPHIKLSDEEHKVAKSYKLDPLKKYKEAVFVFPDAGCC